MTGDCYEGPVVGCLRHRSQGCWLLGWEQGNGGDCRGSWEGWEILWGCRVFRSGEFFKISFFVVEDIVELSLERWLRIVPNAEMGKNSSSLKIMLREMINFGMLAPRVCRFDCRYRPILIDRGATLFLWVTILVGIRWNATHPNWRRSSMLGFLPNQASCGEMVLRCFVGRRFLTLLAQLSASAQNGVGSFELIKLGCVMSKRVRLSRSAAPLEGWGVWGCCDSAGCRSPWGRW